MISKSRLGHLCGNVLYTVCISSVQFCSCSSSLPWKLHFANIAKYDLHEKVLVTLDDAKSWVCNTKNLSIFNLWGLRKKIKATIVFRFNICRVIVIFKYYDLQNCTISLLKEAFFEALKMPFLKWQRTEISGSKWSYMNAQKTYTLKGQSSEILDPQFFSSFEPAWATD